MTAIDHAGATDAAAQPAAKTVASSVLTLPLFASALFVSALLMFSVEPMFTKMVLPLLGGSPSVWSVAMVFFQGLLLLGYVYAHLLTRYLPFAAAAAIHACVLALAFVAMPIAVSQGLGRPPADGQALWLIGLFGVSVGLPFFAVAGNGPLLQAWFARSGAAQAEDPYFLYGASNLGSFAALIAYPLLIEPVFTIPEQSQAWRVGFAALALLIAACGGMVRRAHGIAGPVPGTVRAPALPAPAWRDCAIWTALAFVPSAMLVAVTAHLATDVASAPFLWVMPLAVFLLTFVLAFRQPAPWGEALMLRIQPAFVAILSMPLLFSWRASWMLAIPAHLGAFFIGAMICHSSLYRRRPDARHLTHFYVCMSLGGVLGGSFAALLAPHLFVTTMEYPLLLALGLLARPGMFADNAEWRKVGAPLLALGAALLAPGFLGVHLGASLAFPFAGGLAILAVWVLMSNDTPVRLFAFSCVALFASHAYQPGTGATVYARSFFGVHKAVDMNGGTFRALMHGTTIHGAERMLDDAGAPATGLPEPLTYFYAGGPFAEALAAMRARAHALSGGGDVHVGLVGLGVGALTCQRSAGESWDIFEIDPEVVRLASDPAVFRSLDRCAKGVPVHVGDARLTLADQKRPFNVLILDAFASDVVPVHLLTAEAFALYARQLAPGGAIVMNISNRNIELASVIAHSAAANGMKARTKTDASNPDFDRTFHARAEIAVIARDAADFGALQGDKAWRESAPDPAVRPWSDDYSDIVGAIVRKWKSLL